MKTVVEGDFNVTTTDSGSIIREINHVPTAQQISNASILAQIEQIEAKQHRAVREAVLNLPGAVQRVTDTEARIAALRAQLVP